MDPVNEILFALTDREVARVIGVPYDEVRIAHRLPSNVVGSYAEFADRIGSFFNEVFTRCVAHGGRLTHDDAVQRARRILEDEFRREGGIVAAYNHANTGTEGGMRMILDRLVDAMKNEAIEDYVRSVFERYFAPNDWPQKVEISRQLIASLGLHLAPELHGNEPARYAHNIEALISIYAQSLRQTMSALRRY